GRGQASDEGRRQTAVDLARSRVEAWRRTSSRRAAVGSSGLSSLHCSPPSSGGGVFALRAPTLITRLLVLSKVTSIPADRPAASRVASCWWGDSELTLPVPPPRAFAFGASAVEARRLVPASVPPESGCCSHTWVGFRFVRQSPILASRMLLGSA